VICFDLYIITLSMPEGPEIIITSQYLKTKLRTKTIESITVLSGRYTHKKLKGLALTHNVPLTVKSINSKGKFLWFRMIDCHGNDVWMMNTFGLTGRWSFHKESNSRIQFVVNSNTNKNKKYNLYYIDSRNFGTVEFTDDKQILLSKINKLAPDVLKSDMSDRELVEAIKSYITRSRKDLNLVKTLMDQQAIVSGIGNYLIAEILYDAKLNPHRSLNDLTDRELLTLAHSIRKITKQAYYKNNSGYMTYFKGFMKTHADKIDKNIFPNYHPDIKIKSPFKFKVYQKQKDPKNNNVLNDEIVKTRTIHWVPAVQK
jgi:DNA-formamidopyrimidine glycosylase